MSGKRYLIIGDGAAGFTAAQAIRQADPAALIRIYADDPNPAYFRAALTNYLIGELREEQIWAVPPTFYHELNIERVFGRVAAVDSGRSLLYLDKGGPAEAFDRLLIAAGSSAIQPPFPGGNLPGVMTMRTLQDVRQVMDLVRGGGLRRAVIAGGGPLALEWVQGLHERGVHVSYLLRGDHLMSRVLDKTASDLVLARLRLAGVDVSTNEEINEAIGGKDGRVTAVRTRSGGTIAGELVGVAFGVSGNISFLANSGLTLSPRQAVIVDQAMRTSVDNIFAAGDIAELNGQLLQLWEPARWQGRIAGENMAGGHSTYRPGAHYNATRLYDLDLASVGEVGTGTQEGDKETRRQGDKEQDGERGRTQEIVDFPRGSGQIRYRKLWLRDGRLVGALLMGERKEGVRRHGRLFKRLIDAAVDVSTIANRLLDPHFDLGGWLNTAVLTEKPSPAVTAVALPSPAELRKSQFLKIDKETRRQGAKEPIANLQSPISIFQLQPALANAGAQALTSVGLGTQQLARPKLPVGAARAAVVVGGQRYPLAEASVVIGRDSACAIVLDDPAVSGTHAQISYHQGAFYLRDLGSRNGTWVVDSGQVTVPHRLQTGDVIRLGGSDLTFRMEEEAAGMRGLGDTRKEIPVSRALVMGRLVVQNDLNQSVKLGGRTLVGRDPNCHLVVDDPAVSSIHLEINRGEDGFYALNRGRNGTSYRGKPLSDTAVKLRPGDELVLGQRVVVRFEEVAAG